MIDLSKLVKPLEWVDMGDGYPHKWEHASGVYRIYDFGANWKDDRYSLTSLYGLLGRIGQFPDLAAAKSAAEADHAVRVTAALDAELLAELVETLLDALEDCSTSMSTAVQDRARAVLSRLGVQP